MEDNPEAEDSLGVFLSYSRRDRAKAERIAEILRGRGYRVFRDLDDILPTEAWRERLEKLIEQADAVVFLLSPASAASEICAWEVSLASELNKKIAPIVIEDVPGTSIPPMLSRLNYIFATERDRIDNAVDTLCDALSGCAEWARAHTAYLQKALEWERGGHANRLLLAEDRLAHAMAWLASRPAELPPAAQLVQKFIARSQAVAEDLRRYDAEKLKAMSEKLDYLIKGHIEQIRRSASAFPPPHMAPGAGLNEWDEVATYRNFLVDGGRWHPKPAERTGDNGLPMQSGRLVYYRFPCCDRRLELRESEHRAPGQFRADGCSLDPARERGTG